MRNTMRIGVFGGTFDPVHSGHLIVAEDARIQLELDWILFVPAGYPWMKEGTNVLQGKHRLRMVELAIQDNPHFRVSDVEINRVGPSYSVDTLEEILSWDQQAQLFLIIGNDVVSDLPQWHRMDRVFELCTVVIVTRSVHEKERNISMPSVLKGERRRVAFLDTIAIDISSTEIRRRFAAGQSNQYRLPQVVLSYILEEGLYLEEGVPDA